MPVVINEFEVVPGAPAASATAPSASAGEGEGQAALTQHDFASIIRRQHERLARVWAH